MTGKPKSEIKKPDVRKETLPAKDYTVDVREIRTTYFDPVVWKQMKGMAETFKASGALGANENASTLVMKIQAGYEMGMKPIEAIKSFYFVNGVLNIFGAAVVRRLREHGWKIQYVDEPNKCTATISKDDESYTDTLTFEEARKSGWVESYGKVKAGWYEGVNRKLKLRYGVTSMLIKTYVPEVLGSAVDIAEVAQDTVPLYETSGNAKEAVHTNGNGVKPAVVVPPSADDDKPATDAQRKTVSALAKARGLKADPESMTQGEAKAFIANSNGK
jgi:hypothetical protein